MRLLLDTHIWLWSVLEPERLGRRVSAEVGNPANELWLSPISTWEALMLNAKRRVLLPADVRGWILQATAHLKEAPITHEISLAAIQLPFRHFDPADRFIAASAQVLGLTLVTADRHLLAIRDILTMPNG